MFGLYGRRDSEEYTRQYTVESLITIVQVHVRENSKDGVRSHGFLGYSVQDKLCYWYISFLSFCDKLFTKADEKLYENF